MAAEVDGRKFSNVDVVTIELLGDTECETFIHALIFALKTLIQQRGISAHEEDEE